MPNYHLICADCDHKFSIPTSEDPYNQVCPKCASKNICQQYGVKNEVCIDKMKDCSSCPFNNNCREQ